MDQIVEIVHKEAYSIIGNVSIKIILRNLLDKLLFPKYFIRLTVSFQ